MTKTQKQIRAISNLHLKGVIVCDYSWGISGNKSKDKKVINKILQACGYLKAGLIQHVEVSDEGEVSVCKHYDPNDGDSYATENEFMSIEYFTDERRVRGEFNKIDKITRGRLYKLARLIKDFLHSADCWMCQGDERKFMKADRYGGRLGFYNVFDIVFTEFAYDEYGFEDGHCYMPSTFELMRVLAEAKGII